MYENQAVNANQICVHSRHLNFDTLCVLQDNLMLTQHVCYSRQINADTICEVK
jgi:hypothetical protein